MNYIESSKSYTGSELENVFFRPMLMGEAVKDLGVKVLYNMPVPTTVHIWGHDQDVLKSNASGGWSGSSKNIDAQCTIDMARVKAELSFSASDYYSLVFENLTLKSEVNLDDLSGTNLEQIETEMFREAMFDSIRTTMWLGNTTRTAGKYNTFEGFLPKIYNYVASGTLDVFELTSSTLSTASQSIEIFDGLWDSADVKVREAKSSGRLAYYVTTDIYNLYEKALDAAGVDTSYVDAINGRTELRYHGIPVIDVQVSAALKSYGPMESMAILTIKDNLVMAVNTIDFPGTEIRMWYNPDEMENRQRAIFAIGCAVLDIDLVTIYTPLD